MIPKPSAALVKPDTRAGGRNTKSILSPESPPESPESVPGKLGLIAGGSRLCSESPGYLGLESFSAMP